MRMQPAKFSGFDMLLRFGFLITFPRLFVKMKHHSIACRLNHSEHAADHGAASQQIAYSKGNGKV